MAASSSMFMHISSWYVVLQELIIITSPVWVWQVSQIKSLINYDLCREAKANDFLHAYWSKLVLINQPRVCRCSWCMHEPGRNLPVSPLSHKPQIHILIIILFFRQNIKWNKTQDCKAKVNWNIRRKKSSILSSEKK